MQPISGIITTLNEERNIADAIRSLQQVCDEVIVVDSLSTDHTVEIAQKTGAIVYSQHYLGDGPQKNVALQYVKNSWVLSMDADERLRPELIETIRQLDLYTTPYYGFAFRRRNYVGSRWMKSCGWYPDYLVRLYRHDKLRFAEVTQHSHVPTTNTLRLQADLDHFSFRSIDELFAKPGRPFYSRSAKVLILSGRKVRSITPVIHSVGAFLNKYLLHGGIFAGIDGLTLSLAAAHGSFMKYAKVLEWQRDPQVRNSEHFDEVW